MISCAVSYVEEIERCIVFCTLFLASFQFGYKAGHLARKAAAVLGVIETHILDTPTGLAQLLCKVAHGRENEGDLFFMMANVDCFV